MKRPTRIGLAIALGTIIGAVFGLSLDALIGQLAWLNALFGAALGGSTAYLAYDFPAVLRAIPKAWRAATEPRNQLNLYLSAKSLPLALASATSIGLTATTPLIPLILLNVSTAILWAIVMSVWLGYVWFFFVALSWSKKRDTRTRREILRSYTRSRRDLQAAAIYCNPIMVYGVWLPYGIWWLAKKAPRSVELTARLSGRFTKFLFLAIHSDERLLCMADAAAFAAVAYFVATPIGILTSALAGAAFGVLNYEVVSKRWLKLVPQH